MFVSGKADCPLWKAPCKENQCRWYIQVLGTHPNTGEQINKSDCAIAWLPVLLIENSQQQRSTGAAVESFRNEMVKQNQDVASIAARVLLTQAGARLPRVVATEDDD